ncbi:DUF805 domain-containing protein [Pseudoduganella armeniaca]|uniref:DUF805 domain-containing protein n=1 Tax=Pseudoduganella armeniaca TaxID=2072590 RepID=UPI0015E78F99|nr:DUF805 domain-containing protein [Pseudoduganella armeniaca]
MHSFTSAPPLTLQSPRLFAWSGRIGRLRYINYSAAAFWLSVFLGVAIGLALRKTSLALLSQLLGSLISLLLLGVFALALARRRLMDMGHSGWFALLLLAPLLNIAVLLWLLLGKGEAGANRHGAPPVANTALVKVLAAVVVVLAVAGGTYVMLAQPGYPDPVSHI